MATIVVENTLAQSACPGQSVRVSLDSTDAAQIPNLEVGMLVEVDSSGELGYIQFIDQYGDGFQVAPKYPFGVFASDGTYLTAGETINITTT